MINVVQKNILLKILQHNFATLWHNIPFLFLYFTFWQNLHPKKRRWKKLVWSGNFLNFVYIFIERGGGGRGGSPCIASLVCVKINLSLWIEKQPISPLTLYFLMHKIQSNPSFHLFVTIWNFGRKLQHIEVIL